MSNSKSSKWKRYFTEFMMLFLAVSLGFMADNIREKISEKDKEKEYIRSMIEDVEEDAVNIKEVIAVNEQRAIFLDSLLTICYKYTDTDEELFALNQYFAHVLVHPEFIAPTELTMEQLKNAGGMRLIKSKAAINEIIRYDSQLKKVANQQLYYENYQNKAIDAGTKVLNLNTLLRALQGTGNEFTINDFALINRDELKISELGNSVVMYKGIIEYYIKLLQEMEAQGETLTDVLKREYELK